MNEGRLCRRPSLRSLVVALLFADVSAAAADVADVDLVTGEVIVGLLDAASMEKEQPASGHGLGRVEVLRDGVARHDARCARGDLDAVLGDPVDPPLTGDGVVLHGRLRSGATNDDAVLLVVGDRGPAKRARG